MMRTGTLFVTAWAVAWFCACFQLPSRATAQSLRGQLNAALLRTCALGLGPSGGDAATASKCSLLIARGADPNCRFPAGAKDNVGNALGGCTPLMLIVQNPSGLTPWRNETLAALLKHGADPNIRDDHGCNALVRLCSNGPQLFGPDAKRGLLLVLGAGVDVNAPDVRGTTALMYGSQQLDTYDDEAFLGAQAEQLLLQHGARVNARNHLGLTALMYAEKGFLAGDAGVYEPNDRTLAVLLKHGAAPNLRDRGGRTALSYAAQACDAKGARLLLAHGASPALRDKLGRTPLYLSILYYGGGTKESGYFVEPDALTDFVRTLLLAGARPQIRSKSGETPLQLALRINDSSYRNLLTHTNPYTIPAATIALLSTWHVAHRYSDLRGRRH